MEAQAEEYLRKRDWTRALDILNNLLQNKHNTRQQIVDYLVDRSECLVELGNYEGVVGDCRKIIKLLDAYEDEDNESRARIRMVNALFLLKRHSEAEAVIREWLTLVRQSNETRDVKKTFLETFLERFFTLNSTQKIELWLNILEAKFSKNKTIIMDRQHQQLHDAPIVCIYCNVTFREKAELRTHCQTEAHEMMIMSDEGHDWHWRAPPRGFKSDSYRICENWQEVGMCRYGIQCVEAHGEDELIEWKERFQYREMKLFRAKEKELYGKSYTEELLEKWIQTSAPNTVMRDKIDNVHDTCSCSLSATVSSKNSVHEWHFILKSFRRRPLKACALLQDTHRNHFYLANIIITNLNKQYEIKNNQEWIGSTADIIDENDDINHKSEDDDSSTLVDEYKITVKFRTNIFGTFRQSVVFDFGQQNGPVLVKHLCVDVVPDTDMDKINEIRKEITVSISERWTTSNSNIIHFHSTLINCGLNAEWEQDLKKMYPCPEMGSFLLSNATVTEKKFTRNNYRERMHELLYVEEMERYNLIAQYNLTSKLQIAHSYLLSPNSMAASTAKYSSNGELFASVSLGKELSEDTCEGRLILMHCNAVYLNPLPSTSIKTSNKKIYEAAIEDKGKDMIYLRLSADTVRDLKLTTDTDFEAQIQFQLNRIPYCEWHYTIDKMPNFKIIFPETYIEPSIPWSPSRQWSVSFDSRLNLKQKEAVVAITTPKFVKLPPILVIGPFGTGKTFTLAQAIKELIKEDGNRILLCTHSNSAADLYIKDYLDVWVEGGNENARPFRIYYQKRWVATVSPVVQKYCSIKLNGNVRNFQIPTFEDIEKHKIIVVTLSTSIYLSAMGLPPGFFTHILLDEAAQAIECETITPLALATDNTRIVLAGDHMQLGPDIFSQFVKERNLHISLLERLYDHYPGQFPCKILLCENYRAHETIIQFTSESFYDQKLVSSSKQPKHNKFYPLTFFTTRGEDVQDKNSTAFYNNSEVYEVVERVSELKKNWPTDWGEINEQSIGVVTPYSDQVFRIRSELRKKKIDNVCVERVLNVQGKQFRAIILSTVRTRRTCTIKSNNKSLTTVDYGFLSNSKLLNTAITRAQSLVAVVGDPIALCSLGRCSKVWERFIQICKDNDSLFGITWSQLKFQLDGIELKKIYTLNPLAPEFIPRKYKEVAEYSSNSNSNNNNMVVIRPTTSFNPIVPPPQPPQQQQQQHNNTNVVPPPPPPSPFPNIPPDFRLVPMVYQQQTPLGLTNHRPFIYNVPPPNVPPPQTSHQLTNGFRPSLRVVNAHEVPMVVAHPRPSLVPANIISNIHHPHHHTILQAVSLQSQQNNNKLSNNNQQQHNNSKLIQFMNNVHFPEAQMLNDCINLLPQHMSLADMIVQPASVQERWYNYLRDTTGYEAAEKFKYLLHTTNQKGSRVSEPNMFERTTPLSTTSSDSPTFNWYDSPSNQINFNKPIYYESNNDQNNQTMTNNWAVTTAAAHALNKSNPLYDRQAPRMIVGENGLGMLPPPAPSQPPQITPTIKNHQHHVGLVNGLVNGTINNNIDAQTQLQRHVNEEFANLSINSSSSSDDAYSVFKAFSDDSTSSTSGGVVAATTNNVHGNGGDATMMVSSSCNNNFKGGPRFYKYFS